MENTPQPQQNQAQNQPQNKGYGKGYGKKPLWQWIVIYIVVGGVVYAGIYYFVFAKDGGYNSDDANNNYNYNTNTGSSANYNYSQ